MTLKIHIEPSAQRLTIYIGESDRWRNKPLYLAIIEALKAEGIAGATVVRGVAGYGAHSRIHTATLVRLSEDLPLVIQVVDSPEKIARALELVSPMVREGLIVIEDVHVVKYTHRYLNPLPADRPVSEVMTKEVITIQEQETVAKAWETMLEHHVKGLPVVDREGRLVGILTDEDLIERAGLRQRLSVAVHLEPALLREEFERLRRAPLRVAEVMTTPVISVRGDESLGAAAARMAQSGLKRLPVVNEQGQLVGVLSRVDVLRQVTDVEVKPRARAFMAAAGGTVQEIMDRDVPLIDQGASLAEIVAAFLEAGSHRLIVTDDQGRAVGLISDADVVTRIQATQRRGVLQAFRREEPVPASSVVASELMSSGVLTVSAQTPVIEAASRMLSARRKWMVVIDENERPIGLIDRQILLGALSG